ncbi:MAG: diguanylate cyclase [Myxococcaceae bacterium]|nr:diguanylate cyclase [Myxococcaceae bacterium]
MGETPETILVVDDSRAAADTLAEVFRREGRPVDIVQDGAEAVKRASAGDVALVLLDVELPGIDGLQALRMIRATTSRRYLPVVVLTVHDDRQKRLTAFKLGADDVLQKPWDADELWARCQRLMTLRGRFDELVRETEKLHALSVTDGLTQIHNHRFFQDRLKEEFRRAQRYDDPLALVMLDIDHFKDVNDRHGHPAGDAVLREVAQAIRGSVRDTDLIARYGGEEFAILLPRTHLAGALTVAERVWRAVGNLRTGPGGTIRVTASLGISGFPSRQVLTGEQLLRTADEALYRAKREGRNKICLFQQVSFFSGPSSRTG